MISKREVLKKYLLWRKLYYTPTGYYPHCIYCKHWIGEGCHNRKESKHFWVYFTRESSNKNTKFYIIKSKEHSQAKCIKAFYPGNWISCDK